LFYSQLHYCFLINFQIGLKILLLFKSSIQFGKLGILVALITFFLEIPKRDEQAKLEAERRQFEYWKAIDSAKSSSEVSPDGRFTSYALRMALQNLVEEKDSSGKPLKIRNVDFSGADLHGSSGFQVILVN
jgi:hypothetical protein